MEPLHKSGKKVGDLYSRVCELHAVHGKTFIARWGEGTSLGGGRRYSAECTLRMRAYTICTVSRGTSLGKFCSMIPGGIPARSDYNYKHVREIISPGQSF